MFESGKLEIMGYLGFANVKIWVQDEQLHYSKEGKRPDEYVTDEISPMPAEEFSQRIENLDIREWKNHYEPIGFVVMDGESWMVTYEDSDYKKFSSSGDNAYPVCWNKFIKLLSEVAGDISILK